ncbi:hypothetical protein NY08_818 [Rhodococcus sp. B7740]|nr:hypothetical protein NY08_818 [Rhodococcus sp. B7740]
MLVHFEDATVVDGTMGGGVADVEKSVGAWIYHCNRVRFVPHRNRFSTWGPRLHDV